MQNGATFLLHVLHELFTYSFLRILKKKLFDKTYYAENTTTTTMLFMCR